MPRRHAVVATVVLRKASTHVICILQCAARWFGCPYGASPFLLSGRVGWLLKRVLHAACHGMQQAG